MSNANICFHLDFSFLYHYLQDFYRTWQRVTWQTHGFTPNFLLFVFLVFCVVFLFCFCQSLFCVLCPMLSMSQDCPFLIPISIFPYVHLKQIYPFMSTVVLHSWISNAIIFLQCEDLKPQSSQLYADGFFLLFWGGGGKGTNLPLKTRVRVRVFNITFNNTSVILWQSVLLVEETEVPGENHCPVTSHCPLKTKKDY